MLKQYALGSAIAFAEGVHDVDVGIGISHSHDQVRSVHAFEPVRRRQFGEDFLGFLFHVFGLAKARGLFGHANGAQFPSPLEQVAEQCSMNILQVAQVVGRG